MGLKPIRAMSPAPGLQGTMTPMNYTRPVIETELLTALGELGVAQERRAPDAELDTLSDRVRQAMERLQSLAQAA